MDSSKGCRPTTAPHCGFRLTDATRKDLARGVLCGCKLGRMSVSGVLQILDRRGGFLRDPARSFAPNRQDVFGPVSLIERYRLVSGAHVSGTARQERQGMRLDTVESICGAAPDAYRDLPPFEKLTATQPDQRFHLGAGGNVSMR